MSWQRIKELLRKVEVIGCAISERLRRDVLFRKAITESNINLLRLLIEREFKAPCRPFVILIGANDGVTGDPLWEIRDICMWRGILVEPQPEIFAKLQYNYRNNADIVCENVAIGVTDGEMQLYRYVTRMVSL